MSDEDSPTDEYLFATPGNPIPEGTKSGIVVTPDDIKIRCARWEPHIHPSKGTVVIPAQYQGGASFRDGVALMEKDGKWGGINKQGKVVTKAFKL